MVLNITLSASDRYVTSNIKYVDQLSYLYFARLKIGWPRENYITLVPYGDNVTNVIIHVFYRFIRNNSCACSSNTITIAMDVGDTTICRVCATSVTRNEQTDSDDNGRDNSRSNNIYGNFKNDLVLQEVPNRNKNGDTVDIYKAYTSTTLFQALKPLFVCLQLFGVYFAKDYTSYGARHTRLSSNRRRWLAFSQLYASFVLLLGWFNFARLFTMFNATDEYGTHLFMKLLFISYFGSCCINMTASYYASFSHHCLPAFFLEWNKHPYSKDFPLHFIRRKILICTIVVLAFMLINMAGTSYCLFFSSILDIFIAPCPSDHAFATAARYISIVVHFILSNGWIFTVEMDFIFCLIVYKHFKMFNKDFRNQIKADGVFIGNFEKFRRNHQILCYLVNHADKFIRNHIAVNLVVCSGIICLVLYNMIYDDHVKEDLVALSMSCLWITMCFSVLIIISLGGGLVNNAVSIQPHFTVVFFLIFFFINFNQRQN